MFFLDKYFSGKGLNLTRDNILKYPRSNTYKIPVIAKYNFVAVDFEKIFHQESDLFTFGKILKNHGHLIIRQKITHEECYSEVFYHVNLLNKADTNLIKFESDEEYNYFIFKKEKKKDSMFLGAYSVEKEKMLSALTEISKSFLYKDYFLPLHLYGENELWKIESFTSKVPRFTINCIFTKQKEHNPDNNENALNWNRLINVCRTKKVLLINDDFNIENFSLQNKYSKSYLYVDNIKKARQIGGIDFKYKTIEWSIYDFATRMGDKIEEPEYHEKDKQRYLLKKSHKLLDNSIRWINIHEALGDNICTFNLLESLKRSCDLKIGTVYPFLYELSGDIPLRFDLHEVSGLGFNVYEHGSENRSKTLESAYFSMHGEEDLYENRRWKFFYNLNNVKKIKKEYEGKNVVLIAPSASNREGPDNGLMLSNKTWDLKRWEKIVSYLQKRGYHVVQVGVKEDFKVDNVNEYFFNRSFGELAALVVVSRFFLSLDTFFQHLCGIMCKKGIVITPAHNDHASWPTSTYVVGKTTETFEHIKWLKDHLNPYRADCMNNIPVSAVKIEVDKIIDCFDKY
jgi:hypothetical protein